MNIFLWVIQGLLAAHTLMGAVWKFKNTAEKTSPTLKAIPNGAWMGLAVFEIICAIGLIAPAFIQPYGYLVGVSALAIAAVMVIFCILHVASGSKDFKPMIYWIVVALVCGFVTYSRMVLLPF